MYTPREDSFLIKKHIKEFCKPNSKVLDVGTGSGILAKEASKYSKDVTASDIDNDVIKELRVKLKLHLLRAKTNLCKTKTKQSSHTSKITLIHSNLFSKINKKQKFDLIIFNPPYIPTKKSEFKYIDLDGGKNGTEIIEKFLKQAKKHLKPDGKILLLTSSLNKNIESLFKKYNYNYLLLDEEKFFFEKLSVWMLD
jgi:release factor glutamine methyltransferase